MKKQYNIATPEEQRINAAKRAGNWGSWKKKKCTNGTSCTDCKAEDYLTAKERAKLDAYMENGGTFEDLPLKTRRLLEEQK